MLLPKEALRSGTGGRVILWATAKNLDWSKRRVVGGAGAAYSCPAPFYSPASGGIKGGEIEGVKGGESGPRPYQ